MQTLKKMGGVASLLQAVIYISAFIFFGAFWQFPMTGDAETKLVYLTNNQLALSVINLIMYVLFGVILGVLVMALNEILKITSPIMSQLAAIFGVIWVGLVIASGMLMNIGLGAVVASADPHEAIQTWKMIRLIVEGIGGGNEVVGGLWVLLLSIASLKGNSLNQNLNYFGLFVGCSGIVTIYPAEIFTEIFGLSQIIWFIWLGLILLLNNKEQTVVTEVSP